jgi:hypothetical protein
LSLVHSKGAGHSRYSDTGIYNVKTVALVSFLVRIILPASGILVNIVTPIPVATRSKAWVCRRSFVGIVGSNPTGCMDICLL